MFTGIIEEVGRVQALKRGSQQTVLSIKGSLIFDDIKLGDSVAVNGVCLTVSRLTDNTFEADVMNETLARSSLGSLNQGSRVNLERAMPLNGRFGGHIVSGHIDGTGTVTSIKEDDNAIWFEIVAPPQLMRYIVEKGSVAIDGTSLTVAEVCADRFKVSLIPHTVANTVFADLRAGSTVNLENDVIGKYVEKLLLLDDEKGADTQKTQQTGITAEFLSKHGF